MHASPRSAHTATDVAGGGPTPPLLPKGMPGAVYLTALVMMRVLRYLPIILDLACHIPAVIFGWGLTMTYMLLVVGSEGFTETVSPVAGFHIFMFFQLRELLALWQRGRQSAQLLREREANVRAFTSDIAMQYREKLD